MTSIKRMGWTLAVAAGFGLGYAAALPSTSAVAADAHKADDHKADAHKAEGVFEVYKDKASEFRWRLKSANHQIIATGGDSYKEKKDCMAGIESVRHHAAEAKIVEVEAK